MPYIIKKSKLGYRVHKKSDGKAMSKKYFKTKLEAQKQLQAIGSNEHKQVGGKKSSIKDIKDAKQKLSDKVFGNEESAKKLQEIQDQQLLNQYDPNFQAKQKLAKEIQANSNLRNAYQRNRQAKVDEHYDKEYQRINDEEAYKDYLEEEERKRQEAEDDPFNKIMGAISSGLSFIPGLGKVASLATDALQTGVNLARGGSKKGRGLIRNGYNNKSTKTIQEFGNWKIFKINVYRKPIMSIIHKFLDVISSGKFSKGMADSNYDKMYHLGLFCIVGNEKG